MNKQPLQVIYWLEHHKFVSNLKLLLTFFFYNQLYLPLYQVLIVNYINMTTPIKFNNLFHQIQQAKAKQQNTITFLQNYHHSLSKKEAENQFLDQQNNMKISSTNETDVTQLKLSQMFSRIQIGKEQIDWIQVKIEGQIIPLGVAKNEGNNLSNFSSFNQDKEQIFNMRDLVFSIQSAAGKQLRPQAITKIITSLQNSVQQVKPQTKPQCEDDVWNGIIALSPTVQQNIEPKQNKQVKNFDLVLNSIIHSKKQRDVCQDLSLNQQPLTNRKVLKERLPIKNNQRNYEQRDNQKDKQKKDIDKDKSIKKKPRKRNDENSFVEADNCQKKLKTLKIIKNNNTKTALSMLYENHRNVQNFCILNKIFGKDKQKVQRAIRQSKGVVYLE